jgi:hypothetical protein
MSEIFELLDKNIVKVFSVECKRNLSNDVGDDNTRKLQIYTDGQTDRYKQNA